MVPSPLTAMMMSGQLSTSFWKYCWGKDIGRSGYFSNDKSNGPQIASARSLQKLTGLGFQVYLLSDGLAMKKEIELIMFDLDGTLADTGRDLASAVNYVRCYLDLTPLDDRLVYSHVGRGVEHLLRSSLPERLGKRFNEIMDLFLERYEKHLLDATVLYPHVTETLDYFRDKRKAVVSNKLHHLTVSILTGLGIEGCFDAILGGDSVSQKKPNPEPLREMLNSFGIQPAKAVIVGDGDADIEAGKRAGVCTCGVTYGLGSKEELIEANPELILADLYQLTRYFR